MRLTSPAFKHEGAISSQYTCDGRNVSPPLAISEVPGQAQSLALMIDDPDAPDGEFVHWLVWNIDPKTREIEEEALPVGSVEGTSDFGTIGYGGPCPPSGTHRYFFRLFALDNLLELPQGSDKDDLEEAMLDHVLEKCELVGTYERSESG